MSQVELPRLRHDRSPRTTATLDCSAAVAKPTNVMAAPSCAQRGEGPGGHPRQLATGHGASAKLACDQSFPDYGSLLHALCTRASTILLGNSIFWERHMVNQRSTISNRLEPGIG